MANFIPEDKIREVRNSVDIVEIVSEAVLLKAAGKNFVGLCPFHSEKTPSFTVSPDKQIFHCFGCSEGGSAIDFVMKYDGLPFPEAVKKLAARYGVDIPLRSMSPEQKRRMTERDSLFNINSEAADFYSRCLLESPRGRQAAAYLSRRGMSDDIIRRYKLGYAPGGWDTLAKFFSRKRVPADLVERAGLIVPRKNAGGYYDRLRDRVVFPILNPSNAVIGFGARVMDDTLPKYLNSPETPIFNKSRSLYGLNNARQASRAAGVVYIVEGYFDTLALHQHGFVNAVATLGTSLTSEHVQIVKGLIGANGKIVLVFDSDTAGVKAAKRSIVVFDREQVDAHILILPAGHDPDSFLFENGADAFKRSASGATGIIPFILASSLKEHGLSINGKMRILAELKKPLSDVSDHVARSLYIKEIAERLEIDERAVLEKLKTGSVEAKPRKVSAITEENRIERQIVSMMFQFTEILSSIEELNTLDYFEDETLKFIGSQVLISRDDRDIDTPGIINRLQNREQRHIAAALAFGDQSWHPEGCMVLIRRFVESRQDRRDLRLIAQQIKAAEQSNDIEALARLLTEKQRMAVLREKRKMARVDGK